jgi:hypothetical protein
MYRFIDRSQTGERLFMMTAMSYVETLAIPKLQAIKSPPKWACTRSTVYAFLRRDQPRPASPRPKRAKVAGAGTTSYSNVAE